LRIFAGARGFWSFLAPAGVSSFLAVPNSREGRSKPGHLPFLRVFAPSREPFLPRWSSCASSLAHGVSHLFWLFPYDFKVACHYGRNLTTFILQL
jgi:hypothetical protein